LIQFDTKLLGSSSQLTVFDWLMILTFHPIAKALDQSVEV